MIRTYGRKRKKCRPAIGILILSGILALQVFLTLYFIRRFSDYNSPAPTPSSVAAAAPVRGEDDKKIDAQWLVLVNLDNPTSNQRPENLVQLDQIFGEEVALVNGSGYIQKDAAKAAKQMFLDAEKQNIGPYKITSAYRSVEYQEELFQAKLAENPDYGKNPYQNPVKVLPGNCSEHTTGLALDILSVAYEQSDDGYGETPEGQWLTAHAHEYGFVLRYPRQKEHLTGVIYEPWHYRFVGVQAATEIYEKDLCLEEYLN